MVIVSYHMIGGFTVVYRPTVRYDELFRDYVDSLFHATHLDRNQIIRGALFAAAHSKEFHLLLNSYKKRDVPIPPAPWLLEEQSLWLNQSHKGIKEEKNIEMVSNNEGDAVNNTDKILKQHIDSAEKQLIPGEQEIKQAGEIPSLPIKCTGGLFFKLE